MASLPGATVLYRLKAEGGSRALGGPSEDRLAMCFLHLASLGPGQWGTTGGSRRHICLASSRLCPLVALVWRDLYLPEHGGSELAMEKGLSSLTRGQSPRAGIPRLILSEYAGGERPARHFRDTGDPSLGLSEHTYRVS